jgi:hypothetical protein
MKSYRWLIFLAALLVTVCDFLLFTVEVSQLTPAPQRQANPAVAANVGSRTRSPGG